MGVGVGNSLGQEQSFDFFKYTRTPPKVPCFLLGFLLHKTNRKRIPLRVLVSRGSSTSLRFPGRCLLLGMHFDGLLDLQAPKRPGVSSSVRGSLAL